MPDHHEKSLGASNESDRANRKRQLLLFVEALIPGYGVSLFCIVRGKGLVDYDFIVEVKR